MENISYSCHYGHLEVDLFDTITEDDLDKLIEIAKENGCRTVDVWTGFGEKVTLWKSEE